MVEPLVAWGEETRVPVAMLPQIQLRCSGCNRRLGDFVNEVQAGQVILEIKCPRCGQPHLEVIRPSCLRNDDNRSDERAGAAGPP